MLHIILFIHTGYDWLYSIDYTAGALSKKDKNQNIGYTSQGNKPSPVTLPHYHAIVSIEMFESSQLSTLNLNIKKTKKQDGAGDPRLIISIKLTADNFEYAYIRMDRSRPQYHRLINRISQ